MPYIVAAIIIAAIGLLVFFVRRKAVYYDNIFSDEHYAEVGNWLVSVLKLGPVNEAVFDDRTALRSSAECAFSFTRAIGEKDTIHLAISQIGNPTTHAVAGRFAFLIIQLLKTNQAAANLFYTRSTVHHVVLEKNAGSEWLTREVAAAVADMKHYQPPPFQFQPVDEA